MARRRRMRAKRPRRRGYRRVKLYRKVRRGKRKTANSIAMSASRKPEVKRVIAESTYSQFNSFISVAGDILNVLPNVPQGVEGDQRVGTKIVVKSLTVRGVITTTYPQIAARFAKLGLRHMLLRKRQKNNYLDVTTTDLQSLIERESGPTSFIGNVLDYLSPINKRQWVAGKDRKYNINSPVATAVPYEAPNSTITVPFYWKFAQGARLLYEQGSNVPVNWPWFMALGFTYWDNAVPNILDTPILLQYQSTLEFYDV